MVQATNPSTSDRLVSGGWPVAVQMLPIQIVWATKPPIIIASPAY
jgi:hypothetical protein